jgi:hypothetical protein
MMARCYFQSIRESHAEPGLDDGFELKNQAPTFKLQRSSKSQAPINSQPSLAAKIKPMSFESLPRSLMSVLVIGAWMLSGAWSLEFGAFASQSFTENRGVPT